MARITIQTNLRYAVPSPSSLLLQIEAAPEPAQTIESSTLTVETPLDWHVIPGEAGLGQRRWAHISDEFACRYHAVVRVDRPDPALATLSADPVASLSGEVTPYLMPSRYCHPETFLCFIPKQFGAHSGGALIAEMADWIAANFTYDNGASTASTTATDSFHARAGVCRDYAHVLIAMARAVGIPARMASVYAATVTPPDFHAVAEVYLDGAWHLIDPTGMSKASEMVLIGVGRDAAEVSFMTSYGQMDLITQTVHVAAEDQTGGR